MEWILFWLVFAGVVAFIAAHNGRSGVLAFVAAVLISPLLALIVYLAIGKSDEARAEQMLKDEHLREQARAFAAANRPNQVRPIPSNAFANAPRR